MRVGLEVRPHEVGDEPLARIDDVGARGAGGHRPPLDARAERAAAEIDRERHHLGIELLAQPGDGDRRVETTRIGEDDLLHGMLEPPDRAWMALNRSSQRSRRDSSANRTRSVLSPASVPSCSRSVDSSMAWAMTLAVPGVPVSTRISPLRPIVTGMSAEDPLEPLVGPGAAPTAVPRPSGRDVDVARRRRAP